MSWKDAAMSRLPWSLTGFQAGALILQLPDDWNLDPDVAAQAAQLYAMECQQSLLKLVAALRNEIAERAVPLTFRNTPTP